MEAHEIPTGRRTDRLDFASPRPVRR
jgi:hypothetical protein